jgi:chromosome segregation ATPase
MSSTPTQREASQKTALQLELDDIAAQYSEELVKKDEEIALLKETMETVCMDLSVASKRLEEVTEQLTKMEEHCEVVERVSLGDRQLVHDQLKDIKMLENRVREVIKERDNAKAKRIKEMSKRQETRTELVGVKREYNALLRRTAETITEGENPHEERRSPEAH